MQEFAYQQKLMGTTATVSVIVEPETEGDKIAAEIFSQIKDYENRFSRFIPGSELSELNNKKSLVVSDIFLTVLKRSIELSRETNGAFNPLIQIERQGYSEDYTNLEKELASVTTDKYNLNLSNITIDEKTGLVILQPDQKLDFGGILKGYLATKLAQAIFKKYESTIGGLIINIGGDLHTMGLDSTGKHFEFYLYNPVTESETPLPFKDTSLTTSGTYKRTWTVAGNKRHHILAKDGLHNPVTNIISASIIHKDGALAEAYATMAIVSGIEALEKLLEKTDFKYFIVRTDGTTLTNIV